MAPVAPKDVDVEARGEGLIVEKRPKVFLRDEKGRNVEERANIVSRIFFSFVTPLVLYGHSHTLTNRDFWPIRTRDTCEHTTAIFEKRWKEEKARKGKKASLFKCVFLYYKWELLIIGMQQAIVRAAQLLQPWILEQFLLWFAIPTIYGEPVYKGYMWALTFFFIPFISSLAEAASGHRAVRGLIQVRASLGKLVYEKSLRVSSTVKVGIPVKQKKVKKKKTADENALETTTAAQQEGEEATTGKIVNLMGVDAEKIGLMFLMLPNTLMVPFQVIANLALIWETMKAATLAGVSMIFIFIPMTAIAMLFQVKFSTQQSKFADTRLKVINEVLQGIRVVKFYAWEKAFLERIQSIRSPEVTRIFFATFSFQGILLSFTLMPIFIPVAAFSVYCAAYGELNAVVIFRTMAYFQALQMPLLFIPIVMSSVGVGLVSARRVQYYLELEELDPSNVTINNDANPSADEPPIELAGSFTHGKDSKFLLDKIQFKAARGKLTAIVGNVGSGKSSLVLTMLGEMMPVEGSGAFIRRSGGSVAYVAQRAWIQTQTIQGNILFGNPFDQAKYDKCIEVCALSADLASLQHGDQTEIGDRGINLSGGQKQRIAIARAVYSGCGCVVLDDPLSAVDANVGEHIMTKCFTEELRHTTRVLVMNQLHFLNRCDYIYVIDEGKITAAGTYSELMDGNENFMKLMKDHEADLRAGANSSDDVEAANVPSQPASDDRSPGSGGKKKKKTRPKVVGDAPKTEGEELVEKESERKPSKEQIQAERTQMPFGEKSTAAPNMSASKTQMLEETVNTGNIGYKVYLKHYEKMGGGTVLLVFFFSALAQGCISLATFILTWWSERKWGLSTRDFLLIYGATGFIGGIFTLIRGALFCVGTKRASFLYHNELFEKALRAPCSYYDQTPVGRVLNRFTKDMSDIDSQLPRFVQSTVNMVFMILGSLISTAVMTQYFLISSGVCLVLFVFLQRFYSKSCTQLKRMESVSRSPVYNHFGETLLGLATIRAFQVAPRFSSENASNLNFTAQAFYSVRMVLQWANVRIGFLNASLSFTACLFVAINKGTLDVSSAALAVFSVMGVGPIFGFLIINLTELDNAMNSVERIDMSNGEIPREPEWDVDQVAVPENWPSQGVIEFKDVYFKYRENLPPVIMGLNAKLEVNEKVGVAGRTGSGKSSLMLVLFRMYDIASGAVFIDGVDISKVGLHTLRKRLAIIPQDPVLFSGSIRTNLDPFDQYPDSELLDALEQVQLKRQVELMGGLASHVTEYGENLSVGQRQLLCIARAILRKPKILVMDEATSSVDSGTDSLIQTTVRQQFKNCTTLTIAHRLNTIMDSTKLMVLEQGKLVEFDAPWKLVEQGGFLANMFKAMTNAHKS